MDTRIEIINGREYHLTRMENGAWNIEEDMTEEQWQEYCGFITHRMKSQSLIRKLGQ